MKIGPAAQSDCVVVGQVTLDRMATRHGNALTGPGPAQRLNTGPTLGLTWGLNLALTDASRWRLFHFDLTGADARDAAGDRPGH